MAELSTRYRIPPSFSVVAHSADVVELRRGVWNPVSVTLSDKSESGKLFRALELLDGKATLGEIAEQAGLSRAEAGELIDYLARQEAVETSPTSAIDHQVKLFSETLGATAESDLRFDRVTFLGDPELAMSLGEQLSETGGASFSGSDDGQWAALSENDFTLVDDPLAFREEMKRFETWRESLVVAASSTVHPLVLRNLNRVCLHLGIHWIHAVADGPYLMVGPTFVPSRSSCYECFETRVALSMRESESYARYKRALANRSVRTGRPHLGRPFRDVLASLTALEVVNLMTTGTNFTLGKTLTLFLPTMEFSFNEVLRVPGCAACSPLTEQHEQGLYFDLKGYINSIYSGNGSSPRR